MRIEHVARRHHSDDDCPGIWDIDTKKATDKKGWIGDLPAEPIWKGKNVSAKDEKQYDWFPAEKGMRVPMWKDQGEKCSMEVNEYHRKGCKTPQGIQRDNAPRGRARAESPFYCLDQVVPLCILPRLQTGAACNP
jgi:hypothetical protein